MNAGNANLLNAVVLIGMSVWGYKTGGSNTALIPLLFGAVLLYFTNSIRNHNKTVAHVAVVITLIALVALIAKPLPSAIKKMDYDILPLVRVGSMVLTGIIALVSFIMSFIAARKNKTTRLN